MSEKILVTGGAGFIGSHLVETLLQQGFEVVVLDDFSSGRTENLTAVQADVDIQRGDLRDVELLNKVVKGCRWVFHQAAVPSVPRSVAEPRRTHSVNIDGSHHLLLAARDAEVESVVMASSSSVYGDTEVLPKIETMLPRPLSPYAQQKYTMETMGQVYSRCYQMRVISLRYFNVFGPRQNPHSTYAAVIPKFIHELQRDRSPIIFGDGEQTRDFTFIDNVVAANLLAAKHGRGGLVVNIASGQSISVNALTDRLRQLLGKPVPSSFAEPRPGDVKHSWADIERAKSEIKYEPIVSFEEGLRRTVESFTEE